MPVLFLLGLYNPLCGFVRIVGVCPCVCAAEVKYGHHFAMIQVQIWRVEFIVQSEKFYSHVFSQSHVFCRDGKCSTSTLDAKTLLNLCSLGLGPCLWQRCLVLKCWKPQTTMGGPQPSLRPPTNQQQFWAHSATRLKLLNWRTDTFKDDLSHTHTLSHATTRQLLQLTGHKERAMLRWCVSWRARLQESRKPF